MRRALTFVRVLAVAGLVALVPASLARAGGDGERQDPLALADQLERDGRAHLEQGHKAEGAKLLSKAWAIRADVFAQQDRKASKPPEDGAHGKPQMRPELELLQARVAELKAASNAAEREGKELKEAGKPDRAEAKMAESGRLWKEAEELQQKLEAVRGERKRVELVVDTGRVDGAGAELKAAIEQLRASVAAQRAEAERQAAAGNEGAAHAAKQRAEEQDRRARELEAKLHALRSGGEPRPGAPREGAEAIAGLAQQLEKLMRRMNEMQERLDDIQRRLKSTEKQD